MSEQNNTNEPNTQATEPEKKYTDADVDAIIDKKFAKWKTDQEKAIANAVAQVEEANRLAQMNDKEKADHEREVMAQELAQLKAEKAHSTMMATARKMLEGDGVKIPDDILTLLVADDAEATGNAVKAFSAMFQNAVNEAVKGQLAAGEPKKGNVSATTKEEILSIKDPTERRKAISENLKLFEGMFNGGK